MLLGGGRSSPAGTTRREPPRLLGAPKNANKSKDAQRLTRGSPAHQALTSSGTASACHLCIPCASRGTSIGLPYARSGGARGCTERHAIALPPQIFLPKQRAFSSPSIPRAFSSPSRCALSSSRRLLINAKRLMRCMCPQCLETSMILI